jgi:hypothetical protein
MHDKHQPSSEFVGKLEWEINREVRRRNRSPQPQSRAKAALAVTGLMLVSMGLGGAAVAAAYQAQGKQNRDALISGLESRAGLARETLKLATEKQQNTERMVHLGLVANQENLEGRVKVAEDDAQLKSLESQIEEVRITGREPATGISSPPISGRDFVGERLRIDMSVPQAALDLDQSRLRLLEKGAALGIVALPELDAARTRTAELETAVEGFQKKIEIRQTFLAHKINAAAAELRVLEIEAGQRQKALAPKVEMARKELQNTTARVRMGLASSVDQAEAALRLQQVETELAQADLDLARVRRQLDQHKAGH